MKKDEYFIEKGRSPRNKAMSLAILANNLLEENECFTINITTIIKLVLEKNYNVGSIPEVTKRSSKNCQKDQVCTKRLLAVYRFNG